MAATINAVSGGSGGIQVTGDTTGQLQLQTGGTTAMTVNASQQASFVNNINTPNTFGFKNRIINGGMVIDQRNNGGSITPNNQYLLDRFQLQNTLSGKFTFQQNYGSVTPPTGFSNYLGMFVASAYSVGSSDQFVLCQIIEGYNCSDFAYNTANAKTVTLSFWVYSSLTGTFGGSVQNGGQSRSYPFNYTVSSANTWTQISVTIPGDTAGSLGTGNSAGMRVFWNLGSGSTYGGGTANTWQSGNYNSPTGSVSVVGTGSATFYLTGVQLEVGSTATSFDYRPYGTELALCQRYYQTFSSQGSGAYYMAVVGNVNSGGSVGYGMGFFKVTMRPAPSFAYSGTLGTDIKFNASNGDGTPSAITADQINSDSYSLYITGMNGSQGYAFRVFSLTSSGKFTFSAEL
jgi:hypothetical protein